MKKFTFTILSMLLLFLGGVNIQAQTVTTLYLDGGHDINKSNEVSTDGHVTSATVQFKSTGFNGTHSSGLSGTNWVAEYHEGETHSFTINLNEGAPAGFYFYIASKYYDNFNSGGVYKDVPITAGATSFTVNINSSDCPALLEESNGNDGKGTYQYVWIINKEGSQGATLNIASITRTITTASSVASPTISPASGTYDGDLTVTITKGEGNDKVVYSISGATTGNATDAEFTGSSKTLTLTGTGTITVTAKGVVGSDESAEVTNTYEIPDGKITEISTSYYGLTPLSIGSQEPKSLAFYDFEDDIKIRAWGSNNSGGSVLSNSPSVSINTTDAIKGNKCVYVKNNVGILDNDWQAEIGFETPDNTNLINGNTYSLHFWAKADASVTLTMKMKNRNNWQNDRNLYNGNGYAITTEWQEFTYTFVADDRNSTNFAVQFGRTQTGVYFDDLAFYEVSSSSDPVAFTTDNQSVVIPNSALSSVSEGDYVALNVTGTPGTMAYKEHADNDEYKTPYLTDYTALTQTDGNWLIPVTAGMKTNGLTIKGHDMTLTSADIYKKVVISELVSNAIASKYDNVVVELTRSFVKDTWNTVCLPFVPTADQANTLFGSDYKLAKFTGVSGTTMKFTTIDDIAEFEAGKPYLVMPKAGCATGTTVLFDVNITAKDPTPVPIDNYTFRGTFTTKKFTSPDNTTSRFVAEGNELKTPYENSTLKSLRCYFTVPAAAARSLSFDVDEEGGTTSINTVNGSGVMVNGYYNLNGQRVAKPTKGLFIVNGKKVVIK